MSQKVFNQIQYLCQQIAKVEWSGILFYKPEGSIKDPENFKMILEDILPMHKGSQAYTEYTFDERVIEYLEENEHLEECRMGHIHSHNTMGVFFSGTDWSELEDNAPNHNYYLSLIVNNFMDFCAKVCFIAEAPNQTFSFEGRDEDGKRYEAQSGSYSVNPKLIVYDCDIESPKKSIEVQENFTQRVVNIIQKAERVESAKKNSKNTSIKAGETWSSSSNLFSGKDDAHWTSRDNTLADAIEEDIEEFTMFVINAGNPIEEFKTVEDICDYYASFNVTGKMAAGKVAETFLNSYTSYFGQYKEEIADPELISKAFEEVILELEHIIRTTNKKLVENMLQPCLDIIEKIKENFNKKELV